MRRTPFLLLQTVIALCSTPILQVRAKSAGPDGGGDGPSLEQLQQMAERMMSEANVDRTPEDQLENMMDMNLDETDICVQLASAGKCVDPEHRDDVREVCTKTCEKWESHLESKMNTDAVRVDLHDGEEIFFDLEATLHEYNSAKKKVISFERFEGYLTLVTNLGKTCHHDGVETALSHLVSLFNIVPYSLNIVVFPFRHPLLDDEVHETEYDCDAKYRSVLEKYATDAKYANRLYIMEEAKVLNGPISDTKGGSDSGSGIDTSDTSTQVHPVYQYLKSKFENMQDLDSEYATFFFVSAEGNRIYLLEGSSFEGVRGWVRQLTKKNYDEL